MKTEQLVHLLIACLIIFGVFAMLIISQITRNPLPAETLTILSGSLGSAIGWFFGARGAIAGGQATDEAVTANTQAVVNSAMMEHNSAPSLVEGQAPTATP